MGTFQNRLWVGSNCGFAASEKGVVEEVAFQARDAKEVFASLRKRAKFAGSGFWGNGKAAPDIRNPLMGRMPRSSVDVYRNDLALAQGIQD